MSTPITTQPPVDRRRRGSRSKRRLTWRRRLGYKLVVPIGMSIIRFFWLTCRSVKVLGAQPLEERLFARQPVIFCFWHRHQLFCWRYLRRLIDRGVKIGWLVSPSVDGEISVGLVGGMGGGIVFRGSSTSRGHEALRAMYKGVVKDGISPAATPDGPHGPHSRFKPGMIKLAQLTGAPLVGMAYAARSAWVLKTWDRFVVPRPFTRIAIAVGEPVFVPRDAGDRDVEEIQRQMEANLERLFEQARNELK